MKGFFIFFVITLFALGRAQSFVINGRIVDAKTLDPLALANVQIPNTRIGTTTNQNGEFELRISKKYSKLSISYLGYEPKVISLHWKRDSITTLIKLKEKPLIMSGVVVEAKGSQKVPLISFLKLTQHNFKNIPPLGEPDILFAAGSLPSVNRTGDWKSTLSFEGMAPYQSGIYLNNSRIYHPFHFFGILGSINPEFIKDINVYTSGAPVKYSNVSSGILELQDAPFPNKKKIKTNLSLLFSSFFFQNHRKNIAIQFGFRKTYFDIISRFIKVFPYGNVDGNVKFFWIINKSAYIKIFYDHSNDFFLSKPELSESKISGNFLKNLVKGAYNFGYQNFGFNFTYQTQKGTWEIHFNKFVDYVDFKELIQNNFFENNLNFLYNYKITDRSSLSTGIHFQKNTYQYRWLPLTGDILDIFPIAYMKMDSVNDFLFAKSFIEYSLNYEKIHLIAGLSLNMVKNQTNFNGMFGFSYQFSKKIKVNFQGGVYSQYLASPFTQKELTIKLPIFIQKHSAKTFQFGWGLNYRINEAKTIDSRVYYDYSMDLPYWDEITQIMYETMQIKSYGMSLLFTDKKGLLTYQIFYEWNKGQGCISSNWFPLDWNISHIIKGTWGLQIQKNWFLNMSFTWHSGLPYTPVIAIYNGIGEERDQLGFGNHLIYGTKNSKRFPPYIRMDISIRKLFVKKHFKYLVYLQVINAFNRKNVMRVNWQDYLLFFKSDRNKDAIIRGFPVLPSVGVEFNF
jgi:opacity protein-like surface antigen